MDNGMVCCYTLLMLLKFLLTSWLLIPVGLAVGSYSSLLFPLLDIRFNLINFSILFMTVGLFIYWLIYHEILTTVKDLSVWKLVMIWIVFFFQAGVFFYAFGDSLSPHHNHDASDHVYVIQKIIDSGSNDPKETMITYQPSWYPLGFHSVASFLCLLSGNSNCVMLPWYLIFVVTGFSTIAIFLFTFEYFGKFRLMFTHLNISDGYLIFLKNEG